MKTTCVGLIGVLAAGAARAQEGKRPPITGIAYVRIYAKDPTASQRFYTKQVLLAEAKCPATNCARYQIGQDQYVEVAKAGRQTDGLQVIGFRTTDAPGLPRHLAPPHLTHPAAVQQRALD